jgi:hypothetical protein
MTWRFTKKVWTKDPAACLPFIYCVGPNDINWRRGDAMLLGADYRADGLMVLHFERRPRGGFDVGCLHFLIRKRAVPGAPEIQNTTVYSAAKSWREIIRKIRNAPSPTGGVGLEEKQLRHVKQLEK